MMILTFNHEAEAIAIMYHIAHFAEETNNVIHTGDDRYSLEFFCINILDVCICHEW